MTYKNMLVDSDVLLDLLLRREPFFYFTQTLLNMSTNKAMLMSTSSLVIANIHYVLTKSIGKESARENIRKLINRLHVLPFESDSIDAAINSEFTDFEDAVQHFIAQKHQCDVIISRNIKHYKKSQLPVLTAEQFLRTLL